MLHEYHEIKDALYIYTKAFATTIVQGDTQKEGGK